MTKGEKIEHAKQHLAGLEKEFCKASGQERVKLMALIKAFETVIYKMRLE